MMYRAKFFCTIAVLYAMCMTVYGQQSANDSLEATDSRLNHAYTSLRAGLDEEQQIALRDAQRAWIAYRDAAAAAEGTSPSPKTDNLVLAALTTEQAHLLQSLNTPNFVIATGSAETELKVADNSLNLAYSKLRDSGALSDEIKQAQRAWVAYRDAFAAAYASVQGEPGNQEMIQAAAAKLTELRAEHLQKLLSPTSESVMLAESGPERVNDAVVSQVRQQEDEPLETFASSDTTLSSNSENEGRQRVAQTQTQSAPEVIEVKAEGIGVDAEGARKNAFSRAVETAVGLVVDAETLIENDELVRDQVLTYSDAIVTGYQELSAETRSDGLFIVRIAAKVQRKKLIERLEANNISVKKVDTTGAYASIVTSRKNAADAEALFFKTLDELNYPSALLRAELATEMPEVVGASAGNSDASVTRWTIRISYERDAYFEVLVPKLKDVLSQVASERPRETPVEFYHGFSGGTGKAIREFDRSARFFKLLTRMNETMTNGGIAYYTLSDAIFKKLGERARSTRPDERTIRVSWLDVSGNIIAQKDVQPFTGNKTDENAPAGLTEFFENDVFVAPLFEWAMGYNGGGYVSSILWKIDQSFTDTELAAIQRVQVEFVE